MGALQEARAEVEQLVELGVAGRRHVALRRVARLAAVASSTRPDRLDELRSVLDTALERQRQAGGDGDAVARFATLAARSLRSSSRAVVLAAVVEHGRPSSSTSVPGGAPRRSALLRHRPPPRARVSAIAPSD